MRAALQQLLSDLVQDLLDEAGATGPAPDFSLEAPRSEDHGDFACNAAMLLAKSLRQPPRAIAEKLAERLRAAGGPVARVEVAGPGFVNIWLSEQRWRSLLQSVLASGARYGESAAGAGWHHEMNAGEAVRIDQKEFQWRSMASKSDAINSSGGTPIFCRPLISVSANTPHLPATG